MRSFVVLPVRLLLAGVFFLIIGTFWLLGSLQEPIFYHLVGRHYHPQVNVVSFIVIIPLLLAYMASLRWCRPRSLLMVATVLYTVFFAVAAFLLTIPGVGLPGAIPSASNFLGWALFAGIKAYGSLMVTLFWTYAISITSVELAKTVFPFIVMCAQLGSIAGSTLVRVGSCWGIPLLVGVSAAGMAVMLGLIVLLPYTSERDAGPTQTAGVFEGLMLLVQRPYLRGVFVVSTAYLIITALFDYQMHYLAHEQYQTIEQFAWFKGVYGQAVNGGTLLLSCGATGWLLRTLGIASCLLLYPLLAACCVAVAWWWPTLWVVAGAMVLLRVFAFGLNNPTKEIVYIPEDESVRSRAKGWIDIVGYRAVFALGSHMPSWIGDSYILLVNASAVISLFVVAVWGYYAWLVGKQFARRRRE